MYQERRVFERATQARRLQAPGFLLQATALLQEKPGSAKQRRPSFAPAYCVCVCVCVCAYKQLGKEKVLVNGCAKREIESEKEVESERGRESER